MYRVVVVARNGNGESEGARLVVTTSNIPDMAERRLRCWNCKEIHGYTKTIFLIIAIAHCSCTYMG